MCCTQSGKYLVSLTKDYYKLPRPATEGGIFSSPEYNVLQGTEQCT